MNAKLLRRVRDLMLIHADRFDNRYTLLIDGTEHESFTDHIGRLPTAPYAKAGLIGWIAYAIVEDGTIEIPSGTRLDEPFVAKALGVTQDQQDVLFGRALVLPDGASALSYEADLLRVQVVLTMELFPENGFLEGLIGDLEKARTQVDATYLKLMNESTHYGNDYAMYSKLATIARDIREVQNGIATMAVRAPYALKALCK